MCADQVPDSPYEAVYMVFDYFDGPRSGVACYRDKPYLFKCIFDGVNDCWSSEYVLSELEPETLALVREFRGIWSRWRNALDQGFVDHKSHPALPAERVRANELSEIIKERLESSAPTITLSAEFLPLKSVGDGLSAANREFKVKWKKE